MSGSSESVAAVLDEGERTLASLELSDSGREVALALAGLEPDELRSALLAAIRREVGRSRARRDLDKWVRSLAGFTSWRRPQDLL